MTFHRFKKQVREELEKWLSSKGVSIGIQLVKPPREEMGDISTPLPFTLSKILRKEPYEIALEISSSVSIHGLIGEVRAAKPGYINFYVNFDELAYETINSILTEGLRYGMMDLGKNRKVQIEYMSVNPNKALHIGHARNVCLGEALGNLLSFTGYRVEKISYVNDTGTQMADIMLGFLELGYPLDSKDRFDQYCGDEVYVKVSKLMEENSELREKKSKIAREIETVESEISKMTRRIAERVLKEQLKTCWRLHSRFDALIWESDILREKLWEKAFNILKKSDLVEFEERGVNKGCWVVKLTKLPKFKKETDKVLVRSDGTKTYIAKDVSFAMWKLGLLPSPFKFKEFITQPSNGVVWTTDSTGLAKDFGGADLSINVIDVRQRRLQEAIKIILSSIYGESYGKRYIHYAYEVVSLSNLTVKKYIGLIANKKIIHMSGRRGIYVNVDPILDLMKEIAIKESLKRNEGLSRGEVEEIGEKIAVASLKYALISADLDKIVVFDVDKALNISEESGSYILYGYARACKILSKSREEPIAEEFNPRLINSTEEVRLIKLMAEYPELIINCASKLSVKELARYMYELTIQFNKFYEKCPVLSEKRDVKRNRLLIVKSYVNLLENIARILSIPLVKRM